MDPTLSILKDKRVLIAEDNEDLRTIFSIILNPHFTVQTACDGQEALDHIASNSPDLLILDINMPNVSGIDVLNTLSQQTSDAAIDTSKLVDSNNVDKTKMKVIVLTGNSVAIDCVEVKQADVVLMKPVDCSSLVTLAKRMLM